MLEYDMHRKSAYPQRELATRLREAMDENQLGLTELAQECGVTPQAVYSWRLTGRIGKQHLVTIARLTKKPLEYFLVGLSRAAVVLLWAIPPLMVSTPSDAAVFDNKNIAKAGVIRIALRRWLKMFNERASRLVLPHPA